MRTSESVTAIATALATAQGAMKPASKDASNPAFKGSRYADLAAVWDAIRQPFTTNGICVLQEATLESDGNESHPLICICVRTRLLHKSGEWIEFDALSVPLSKQDAHGVGSATTYARRYALSAALGIVADEDDDGNGAVQRNGARHLTSELPEKPKAAKPAEFEKWLGDLMAVSMTGSEPLRKAWVDSPANLRAYLTSTDPDRWEKIKNVAAKISSEVVAK